MALLLFCCKAVGVVPVDELLDEFEAVGDGLEPVPPLPPPVEPVLKNHSVSLRNWWEAFCDSACRRWFSSRSRTIVSVRAPFSRDSLRTSSVSW